MKQELLLQPRLQAIARLVPQGSRLADVGTDHGYIPVWLLLEGRISSAIASDIGAEPLAHARRTAEQCAVTSGIDFRLCDGLSAVAPEEVDTIVIAGMGGDTIAAILELAPWTKRGKTLLLQPMTKAEVLRRWLPEHGYRVTAEQLAADKGVLYPILTAEGGKMQPISQAQAEGGILLQDDPLWGIYLDKRILRLRRAALGMQRGADARLTERIREMEETVRQLVRWRETQ